MRTLVLTLCLLLPLARAAHAQASELPAPASLAVRPMPPETKALLFFAGIGGGMLASGVSAGLGFLFSGTCDERDLDCETASSAVFLIVGGSSAALGVPLVTASFVTLAGRSQGYRGRMGHALLGSLTGSLLGTGLAFLTFRGLSSMDGVGTLPAGLASLGAGLVTASGVSSIAYWASDRKLARLAPSIEPQTGGLSFGLSARF